MGFSTFLGNLLLGSGPLITVYWMVVKPRALLVLVSFASAFAWLVAVMACAMVFRPFPARLYGNGAFVAAVALAGALVLEALRFFLYKISQRGVQTLNQLSRQAAPTSSGGGRLRPPSPMDVFTIGTAIGCGLGIAHAAFFQWSTLELSLGDAVYYLPKCGHISMNFSSAVLAFSFSVMHAVGTPMAFYNLSRKRYRTAMVVPAAHVSAAVLSSLNSVQGACTFVLPLIFLFPIGLAWVAASTTLGSLVKDENRWQRHRQLSRQGQRRESEDSDVFRLEEDEEDDEDDGSADIRSGGAYEREERKSLLR